MRLNKMLTVLCTVCVLALVGCTNSENDKIDSVRYFAVDSDGRNGGIILYAVMKYDDKDGEKSEKPLVAVSYDGENVQGAFSAFFAENKNIYTGTIKEYAVSEALGERTLEELKIYITDSPRLPAKRKTVVISDVNGYLADITAPQEGEVW